MSSDIQKQIEEVINDHLPQATASKLKDFFEQYENMEECIEDISRKCDKFEDQVKGLEAQNEELTAKLDMAGDIDKKAADLNDRERDIQMREDRQEILMLRRESELFREHHEEFMRMIDKVFGHPATSITRTHNRDVVTPIDGGSNCCGYAQRDYLTDTETTTTQESKQ